MLIFIIQQSIFDWAFVVGIEEIVSVVDQWIKLREVLRRRLECVQAILIILFVISQGTLCSPFLCPKLGPTSKVSVLAHVGMLLVD